jgi:purine-binding chemotaxis protein CheW
VKGVINLRGAVLPIVDMAARMGFPRAEPGVRHVIIVVWIHGQLVGLLVDAVCDIIAGRREAPAVHARHGRQRGARPSSKASCRSTSA